MGFHATENLCLVSLFYLPWVLKVWWKPLVDHSHHFRLWILTMQFLLALSFALLAFSLSEAWQVIGLLIAVSWLTAIHNVAADGFARLRPLTYRHSVVQELFRKFALIVGQGFLLVLAGNLQVFYRHDMLYAWRVLFYFLSGIFMLLFFWHVWTLPRSRREAFDTSVVQQMSGEGWSRGVLFLLFYAFAQAMVGKVSILFLIDTFRNGGVGLSPQEFGFVMGIVGIVALTFGGFLGRKAVRRFGLYHCLMPMTLCMLIPCVVYVALSYWQPEDLLLVGAGVLVDQLAYGLGFAAYLSYLKLTHYRECGKSLMALSLLLGCLVPGPLVYALGYNAFFVLSLAVSFLTILSSLMLRKHITLNS
jgi:PAT family beta-lactamase induction signal transducer AmpG